MATKLQENTSPHIIILGPHDVIYDRLGLCIAKGKVRFINTQEDGAISITNTSMETAIGYASFFRRLGVCRSKHVQEDASNDAS